MKKLVLGLFVLCFGLVLVSCGETEITVETTTEMPTTQAPTTQAPTTQAPTTQAPTTQAPTTQEPTTQAPTTVVEDAVLNELYEGSHTVSAMGSDVVYNYEISFNDGSYYFLSSFEMAGEVYTYEEEGTYSVSGMDITLTPDGEDPVTGEYLVSGNISIPIKASAMATRGEQELEEVMISRIYLGTHDVSAMGSSVTYAYQMLFAHGEYTFFSEFEMAGEVYRYYENGTFELEGNVLTITPDGEDPVVGSVDGDQITIGIKASAMASRGDQTLSTSQLAMYYEGSHVVSAMGSEVTYNYIISFVNGNYNFTSTFTMSEVEYEFIEFGTYVVVDGVITLSLDGGDDLTGSIIPGYKIIIPVKASEMGTRADRTLMMFIPAEVIETE